MDCGFLGVKESEDRASPVLVIRERRHKMTWVMLVPRKGTEFLWIAKRAAKFIDQLGHNRVALRCDNEPAIEALAREIAQARQEGSQIVPERESASGRKSVQLDHRARVGARCQSRQDTDGYTGASHGDQSPARRKVIVLAGGMCGIPDEQVRHRQRRKDTAAKTSRAKGQHADPEVWPSKPARGGRWEPRFHPGVCVGILNSSSEAVVVTEQGLAVKTRSANIRRVTESERWDADRILEMRATLWSRDGSDSAFDVQVGMQRPAEMVPRPPGEVLMEKQSSEDLPS